MANVLIISPDPHISYAVNMFLAQDHHTQTCRPGRRAEQLARQPEIDVVIADVKTPEDEEMDFISRIKRAMPGLPVIFLSLYASQLWRSKGTQDLFHDALFFPKPFDNQAVAAAVSLLAARRREDDQLAGPEAQTGRSGPPMI
ncbi:MAG: response regulator [Planctomycetes bacterium]|nr:response regulator [Planctomycetota bacterium]